MITRTYQLSETGNNRTSPEAAEEILQLPHLAGKLAWLGEKDPLFLDIETTGLSPRTSHLYQITICHKKEVHQWFLDRPAEEKEMLVSFHSYLAGHVTADACLVTYNGSTFDLPYLEKKAAFYSLNQPLSGMRQIDLYALLRPYRKLISPDSFKQKDLERYVGLDRQDPYSGGDLISIYHHYLETASAELLHDLLLHNLEDVIGMIEILPALVWRKLFSGEFEVFSCHPQLPPQDAQNGTGSMSFEVGIPGCRPDNNSVLYLSDELFRKLFIQSRPFFSLTPASSCNCMLTLTVEGIMEELRHFLPDYKNYYYLIREDSIVPKSLAEFVDPEFRRRAKASDCFVRQTGFFLPQAEPVFQPEFQISYRSLPLYFKADQLDNADGTVLHRYIRSLLSACLS